MKYILAEDLDIFASAVSNAVAKLGSGNKRVELEIETGDGLPVAALVGYWAGDLMRIDIKFRK